MKKFADLNLCLPLKDNLQIERMINKAKTLGYNQIGVPLSENISQEYIKKLRKLCKDVGLDFVSRINIYPRKSNELLHNLRVLRRKFEIIAVRCDIKDVARQAAKDRRVDILQFSVTNMRKRFFDKSEADLASQSLASLEIELAPMLQLTSFSRIRLLSSLRKEVELAQRAKVPIILSSGATNECLMRNPYDLAALGTLFDYPVSSALKALSENPFSMVSRNRKKLSPSYVAPGIHVIGRNSND